MSLIHQGAGEHCADCIQYKEKVQGESAFASFVELILYVYSTKTPSPVNQWLQECKSFMNTSKEVPALDSGINLTNIAGMLKNRCQHFRRLRLQPWMQEVAQVLASVLEHTSNVGKVDPRIQCWNFF